MDLFYDSKKVDDYANARFEDILENDMFTPSQSQAYSPVLDLELECDMDPDWLDTFFDDPILNDRMISDAIQPQPQVQNEHSYSMANNERGLDINIKTENDMETEALKTTVNPNSMTPTNNYQVEALSAAGQLHVSYIKAEVIETQHVKEEAVDPETTMVTVTRTTNPQTLLKPTIILATQQPSLQQHSITNMKQERVVLPKVSISVKSEPATHSISSAPALSPDMSYDQLSLPPTPPSSSSSDSDGCQSPERSLPSSPVRHAIYQTRTSYRATPSPPPSAYSMSCQPFFMHPIPSSGLLILSEEEKRTLVTEGYPIPAKLPLTKTEEKNLKKIRRKIKNKISAQESRRKKKEYLESLERKVESFCLENVDLKKKVDNLENSNRSLMSQLHKLQSLVSKVRPHGATVSTAGSCLMVLVLCFAVFLGSWSPVSMTVGYTNTSSPPSAALHADMSGLHVLQRGVGLLDGGGRGDGNNDAGRQADAAAHVTSFISDPYTTPALKSRVLMSLGDEEEEVIGPKPAPCLHDLLTRWFNTVSWSWNQHSNGAHFEPALATGTVLNRLDVESENNGTGENEAHPASMTQLSLAASTKSDQALMHPDMAVVTSRKQLNATQ